MNHSQRYVDHLLPPAVQVTHLNGSAVKHGIVPAPVSVEAIGVNEWLLPTNPEQCDGDKVRLKFEYEQGWNWTEIPTWLVRSLAATQAELVMQRGAAIFALEGKDANEVWDSYEMLLEALEPHLAPVTVDMMLSWLYGLFDSGKREEAHQETDQLMQRKPNAGIGYFVKGSLLAFEFRFAASVPFFDQAIELTPTNAFYYAARARSRFLICDTQTQLPIREYVEASLVDISRALLMKPDPSFYVTRANINIILNRSTEAGHDCDYAIAANPKGYGAYFYKAIALAQLGDYREAMRFAYKAFDGFSQSGHAKGLIDTTALLNSLQAGLGDPNFQYLLFAPPHP